MHGERESVYTEGVYKEGLECACMGRGSMCVYGRGVVGLHGEMCVYRRGGVCMDGEREKGWSVCGWGEDEGMELQVRARG